MENTDLALCRQSKILWLLSFEGTACMVRIENFIPPRNAHVSIETLCLLKSVQQVLVCKETYARYSAWQVPLTTPAGYSFLGNLRCFVKLSFVYRAWFAIPAARDTRNTQLLFLLVVSWQYRILRTCWMSKTFANCNLNWAVSGWPGISSVFYGLAYWRILPTFGELWK